MGRKLFALLVAGLFLYTASPLLLPVIMGAVCAVLFIPLLERLERFRVPTALAAALLTLAIAMLVLAPAGGLGYFAAKSGFQQLRGFAHQGIVAGVQAPETGGDWIDALIDTPKFRQALLWFSHYFPVNVESLADSAHDLVHSVVLKSADWLGQFLAALPGLILALAVTTVSLFFFLVDGRNLVAILRRNTLFTPVQTEQLIHTLAGMCRSVILASIVSGLVQSSVMLATAFILGVPNAPLVAGLVFLGSFIPVIGSAPVTIGVTLHQFFLVDNAHGIAMLVMAGVIATIDNFVRPMFLRGSANLHPLLAFVAAFGGLQVFGFIGVFLGPIIAGLFVATFQILLEEGSPA